MLKHSYIIYYVLYIVYCKTVEVQEEQCRATGRNCHKQFGEYKSKRLSSEVTKGVVSECTQQMSSCTSLFSEKIILSFLKITFKCFF